MHKRKLKMSKIFFKDGANKSFEKIILLIFRQESFDWQK